MSVVMSVSLAGITTSAKELKKKSADQVTLKLWHVWAADSESNRAPFLKVVDAFEKANPNIKIDIDATEAASYSTKLQIAAAANELPDVFYSQAAGAIKNYVEAGKILPLNSYLNDGTKDRIVGGSLTNMTFDGKIYGLPYTLACAVFFVNKDMFDKNKIKIPTTYKELVAAVKAFRAKGITPMTVGGKDQWPITQYFDIMAVRDAGYQVVHDAITGKGSFVVPGIIDAAKKLQELVKMKAFNDGAIGLTRDESEIPFYEGQIPMYVNGNWTCANIQKDESKIKGKVLALRFPIIEGGKGNINDFTGGAAEGFFVSNNTKHKAEAVKLLKYLAENHSREAYLVGAGMPTWKMNVDDSKIDPLIKQVVTNTKSAKTFTLWWDSALDSKNSDQYHSEVSQLFALKITPEQFCKDMQKMNKK